MWFRPRLFYPTKIQKKTETTKLLSIKYSSWTFMTTIRGRSPQGYVLSFDLSLKSVSLSVRLAVFVLAYFLHMAKMII